MADGLVDGLSAGGDGRWLTAWALAALVDRPGGSSEASPVAGAGGVEHEARPRQHP